MLERNKVKEVAAVLDSFFKKAWSIRHPLNSRKGYSDREAKVGRTGRTYDLGYKLHLSIDSERKLPLASLIAPANQNEKRHSLTLMEKTERFLRKAGGMPRSVIHAHAYLKPISCVQVVFRLIC